MKIIQRVGYYLGGVAIGVVLLAFFLKGKMGDSSMEFAYFPEARVLKSLRHMPFTLSAKAKQNTLSKEIDSTVLSNFYKTASVDFSKSNPRKSDCFKEYILNGNMKSEEVQMHLSLNPCDSLVHIEDIIIVH